MINYLMIICVSIAVGMLIAAIIILFIHIIKKEATKKHSADEKKGSSTSEVFQVKYGIVLKLVTWMVFLIMSLFLFMCAGNYFFDLPTGKCDTLGPVLIFSFFTLMILWFLLVVCFWKVYINGEEVIYRNCIGIRKRYNFKELMVMPDNTGGMKVFCCGKKVFTIESLALNREKFKSQAPKYNVFKG